MNDSDYIFEPECGGYFDVSPDEDRKRVELTIPSSIALSPAEARRAAEMLLLAAHAVDPLRKSHTSG
jgi:hypothetical protein